MVVTLELPPEIEQRIIAQAAARGITLEAYLKSLIEMAALVVSPDKSTVEEFEADMDAFSEGTEHLPVLPSAPNGQPVDPETQRNNLLHFLDEVAKLAVKNPDDGLSGRDHDAILYGRRS